MARFTDIDHIQITVDYTPPVEPEPTTGCTPYLDCDNKNESLESLFKRLIVEQDDGKLAIRTCCE